MLLPFTLVQRIRRVAIIAGVISLFTLYSNTGALGEGRRSNLEVFRYAATEAPDELTAFRRFEEAVSAKVLALNDELGQRIRLHSLSQLKLVMVQDAKGNQLGTTELSTEQLDTLWSQRGALALLTGRLQNQDKSFRVRTRVYLGSLHGALPSPFLSIELPVRDEEFDTTRDSHSAMTLYALAMDSLDDCESRDAVTAILSEALSRAEESRNAFGDFEQFRGAIIKAVEVIKEHCR